MTAEDPVEREGRSLLAPGAPALKRIVELEDEAQPGIRVFIAGRHKYVDEILRDDTIFSLEHYDRLLAEVAGPTLYFVSDDEVARARRFRMLQRAQAHVSVARGGSALGPSPQLAGDYRAWIARITRREARQVLAILKARRSGEQVNFVREYAYLVAYRVARQVVGVPGPDRPPWFARLLIMLRNLSTPGRWIPVHGELGAATSILALMHPLFGHVFGTVIRSPAWIKIPARWGTRHALELIDRAMAMPQAMPAYSLLRALGEVRHEFEHGQTRDYDVDARSILFELASALTLIVGKSLSDCVGFVASSCGEKAGTSWGAIVEMLSDEKAGYPAHDAVINEMMRFAGAARLVRTVRTATTFHNIPLQRGDRILALVNVASCDPASFPDPSRFNPNTNRPYLTSGPFGGKHVCYGRAIAWTVMREALVEAAQMLEPAPGTRLRSFAGLPDDMTWRFREPPVAERPAAPRRAVRSRWLSGSLSGRFRLGHHEGIG